MYLDDISFNLSYFIISYITWLLNYFIYIFNILFKFMYI